MVDVCTGVSLKQLLKELKNPGAAVLPQVKFGSP